MLGLIGWALGGYRLLSIFIFCGALLAAALYWYADRIAVGLTGARELPSAKPRPALSGRAARRDRRSRKAAALPDGGRASPRVRRRPRSARPVLALSAGFLSAASPAELEAVIAHELAHVRNRDIVVQTSVVVLAATLLELTRVGGWFSRALLFVFGPVAAAFVHLMLSPKREFLADAAAAGICDSPHPMADALVRLDQASELVSFQGSPATEPLYTINPFLEEGLAALFVTHPPVGERVRRLRELDPDWREKLRAA